ncbi:transposase [Streptomyces sp. NPDC004051]
MRRPPTRTTGTAMKGALQRVEDIAAFHLGRVKLDKIPPNRLSALARYGLGTKAAKLERASEPKRTAMLTAVMRYLEAKAIDDALDLFEILMATRLISAAKRSTDKQRLSTLPQLEKASRLVARAAAVFIEELELIEQTGCDVDVAALWAALEEVAPRAALSSAAYLRSDTIAAANAALIEAQGRVPVVEFWGKGLLASVDGLRFVVPTRTINAAPSPKYFAKKKGITWLNAINDQVIGIGQMVVPGTPRDSLFILDALLNLDGGVKPEMVATDNASYSDMVFGIFKMLGYRFSPRFKDLEDQRFWKAQMPGAEAAGGYGPLEAIARNKVNVKKVITHWPDMLRVAGSLVTNQVRAYDLLRMFGRGGHPTPLGQAFAEYGRIAKTLHLLAVVDPMDDTYRRQMHKQLTVQESRHKLAREICHGKKGTIHQAYRDGMEDQLGSLGLVLNAVVLWTTRYIDAAVAQLRAEGHEIRDEDVARLSPLKHKNLNVLGRYSFTASTPAGGGLRPLRDPETVELDEDDDGQE